MKSKGPVKRKMREAGLNPDILDLDPSQPIPVELDPDVKVPLQSHPAYAKVEYVVALLLRPGFTTQLPVLQDAQIRCTKGICPEQTEERGHRPWNRGHGSDNTC